MKNILQSGLALGIPSGCCPCTNMNFNWLYENPVNLLWVDKVIITRTMRNLIKDCRCSSTITKGKEEPFAKSTKLIYDIMDSVGLIEVVPDDSIDPNVSEGLYKLIESDIDLLGSCVREEDTLLKVDGHCHCVPSLWALYASLYLSWKNNASFMLEEREVSYLKQVIPLRAPMSNYVKDMPIGEQSAAINDVLRMSLPKFDLGHNYLYDSPEHCNSCAHHTKCKDGYLSDIEKQLFYLLDYRERDEVKQLCSLMDRVCSEKFRIGYNIDANDLLREINVERIKVQKKLNATFNKVQKWKNIVMTISAGMTLGAFLGHPIIASIGATGVLASEVASELLSQNEKKYRWINLFNES